jgi:hypothetical protein
MLVATGRPVAFRLFSPPRQPKSRGRAEIERIARLTCRQPVDGRNMGVSEVTHMRVVADAGADRRGIVIPEYLDRRGAFPVGATRRTIGIGASLVEVAQRHVSNPVCGVRVLEHPFDHELGVHSILFQG